jgi:DNA-binding MarR family transcriptional regulator
MEPGERQHGAAPSHRLALEPFPSKQSAPYLVFLLSRLLQGDYLARIAATGIAPAQAFVLAELWQEEPLSQVELSRRLDIGKATVGQTLNRLERSGLIQRRRVSTDRRLMMIYLTERGRALREPLAQAAWEQLQTLREALGGEALNQFTELLDRTVNQLRGGEAAGAPGPGAEPAKRMRYAGVAPVLTALQGARDRPE